MTDQEKNGEAMSEWRPEEGWDEQVKTRLKDLSFDAMVASLENSEYYRNIYEAGADAILAVLREYPIFIVEVQGITFQAVTCNQFTNGRLVFIPDVPLPAAKGMPDQCEECPSKTLGNFGGHMYCGICGWLVEESRRKPNSETRKRIENG